VATNKAVWGGISAAKRFHVVWNENLTQHGIIVTDSMLKLIELIQVQKNHKN
jgi:hypothetical protein